MANAHNRKELAEIVGHGWGREISARTILFHQAMAHVAGVSAVDLKCLDYIDRNENVTAGDLARITGLTTGAITAAIDRLEKAKLARRQRSTTDRRKVFLRLRQSPELTRLMPIYKAMAREMEQLTARYSQTELETIRDFGTHCIEILHRQTQAAMALAKKKH
jgi:DNA-binding MarR family transcriptional regulator